MQEDKQKNLAVWHEKKDVNRQMKEMIEIMKMYCKIPRSATNFVFDLQLYKKNEDTGKQAHPRIWLTSNDSSMGIHLMLYSVDLTNKYGQISNEDAIEVFSEYMKYYVEHSEDFTYPNYDGSYDYSIDIKFEISNRG